MNFELGKRYLVQQKYWDYKSYHECTVLEISPSKDLVKVRWEISGSNAWILTSEYKIIEVLSNFVQNPYDYLIKFKKNKKNNQYLSNFPLKNEILM